MSDTGEEYVIQDFKAFYSEKGIRMNKTVLGIVEQNDIAERKKRILNERAKSMKIHSELPKYFWTEAVHTSAYLINKGASVCLYVYKP